MTEAKREHRETAVRIWNGIMAGGELIDLEQALAEAEQRGRREEQAAVKAWLDDQGELELADGIEHGLHLEGEE